MNYKCTECGRKFEATTKIDRREEAYSQQYEPPAIYCPNCGSDVVEPS